MAELQNLPEDEMQLLFFAKNKEKEEFIKLLEVAVHNGIVSAFGKARDK